MSNVKSQRTTTLSQLLIQKNLRTLFQPIVKFNTNKPSIYGVEALTRGPKGSRFESAKNLFNRAEKLNKLYELERVSRQLAIKRFGINTKAQKLFLNVDPNVIYDHSFTDGNTLEYLNKSDLKQENIIIEITERNQVNNREAFQKTIEHYRNQGFQIAVDDVGSGYSNLDKISRLKPDYIKIDMKIIRNLHKRRSNYKLVETLINFADGIHSDVIAEGIENEDELRTLLSLGIEFGQGYFLSRPQRKPTELNEFITQIHNLSLGTSVGIKNQATIGELAHPARTFPPDTFTKKAYRYLEEHPEMKSLVIVQDKNPIGLIMRNHLYQKLSTNVGHSLYWEREIKQIMEDKPLIVASNTNVSKVAEMAINRGNENLYDEVIVVDPDTRHYRGNATVHKLLEKMTKIKTRKARQANPLTGLPGNATIQNQIQSRIERNQNFALTYVDLDHFKPFNDYYGFERGDKAILLLKSILQDGLSKIQTPHNFLGHVGGDDFVVITSDAHVTNFCEYVIQQFDDRIQVLYDEADLDKGSIKTKNRTGEVKKFNIMTVSLAVVTNQNRSFENHLEMSEVAAEMKKYAKRNRTKSTYESDRRVS